MAILVSCPGCGGVFQTRDENAGREAECPDCGRGLVVSSTTRTAFDLPGPGAEGGSFTSGKAIASLTLGLMSLGCLFFSGIPAVIYGFLATRDMNRSRGRVRGRTLAVLGILLGALGSTFLPALLIYPAIESGREAARRSQCVNNLKQIGLALHNFHGAFRKFPPAAIQDKQGRPLLSWRVAILPYLGPEGLALYQKFNLAESWDGPTNSPLLNQMPAVFACPTDVGRRGGVTRYQAFVGPRGMFTGKRLGVSINEITDGTSATIMVAEMALAVPWTAPEDATFNPGLLQGGMGSPHPGGAHMLTADGAVRFVHQNIQTSVIGALLTRDGGEMVYPP